MRKRAGRASGGRAGGRAGGMQERICCLRPRVRTTHASRRRNYGWWDHRQISSRCCGTKSGDCSREAFSWTKSWSVLTHFERAYLRQRRGSVGSTTMLMRACA